MRSYLRASARRFPEATRLFPVGAAGNRAAVRRFVSRRVGQRRVAAAADSRVAAQRPRARRSGAAHRAAVRRRAGRDGACSCRCPRRPSPELETAGPARPAGCSTTTCFARGIARPFFAERDGLPAARRLSAGRPGQPGGYPGDAGARVGADAASPGSIKNGYDGHASRRIRRPDRRYLYVNARFYALRRDLFDQNAPERISLRAAPCRTANPSPWLDARRRGQHATLPHSAFRRSQGDEMVPYFSRPARSSARAAWPSATVYTFSGPTPERRHGRASARLVLAAAQPPRRLRRHQCAPTIWRCPDGVGYRAVYALAGEITQDAQTDFDRAGGAVRLSAQRLSRIRFCTERAAGRPRFRLVVSAGRAGRATARPFATAMAVMARMVGLPARHVEGYAAAPDGRRRGARHPAKRARVGGDLFHRLRLAAVRSNAGHRQLGRRGFVFG